MLNFGLLDPNTPAQVANSLYAGQQRQTQNALAAAQLQQATTQNDIAKYSLSAKQRDDAQAQAFNNALSGADLSSPTAARAALPTLMKANPTAALAFQKSLDDRDKAQIDQSKAKADVAKLQLKNARDVLSVVNDPTTWAAWRANTVKAIPELDSYIPQQFSPESKTQMLMEADQLLERASPKLSMQDTGGKAAVGVNPYTGKVVSDGITKTQSPDSAAHNAVLMRGQNMQDARAQQQMGLGTTGGVTDTVEKMAQGIAGGQLAPLSGFALAKPMGQQIMARAMEINPQYNAKDFATSQKSEKDFATGKQGNSARSFNVALDHLDTLDKLSDALNNKDTQLFNKIGNLVATQTGKAAPTNFNAAKSIVADEIVKAIVGSGGALADREEAARTVNSANSPEQLKGVIQTYKQLMGGQLSGLEQQYSATTGKKDFRTKFLTPSAQATLSSPEKAKAQGGAKFLGFE